MTTFPLDSYLLLVFLWSKKDKFASVVTNQLEFLK